MSFIEGPGIPANSKAQSTIQNRDCNLLIYGGAAGVGVETRIYFETQGPKAVLTSTFPPALSIPMAAEVNAFNGDTAELGRNELDDVFGTAQPIPFAYTGGAVTLTSGAASVQGGDFWVPALGRYNMTADLPLDPNFGDVPVPGHWIESPTVAPFGLELSFSSNVRAFATYITDLGDFDGTFTIRFFQDAIEVFSYVVVPVLSGNGNLSFFGLATTAFTFNRILFDITQINPLVPDILGFDSLIVATPSF